MLRVEAAQDPVAQISPRQHQIPVDHGPSKHLNAWWWSASADQAEPSSEPLQRPTILLLHGCGGMLNRDNQPDQRMSSYAALLNAKGWHVLALDSFSSRGIRQICTRDKGVASKVGQTLRRSDVAAAFNWLHHQASVDASSLALVGWSNGGGTVLEYVHRMPGTAGRSIDPGLRAAAAFYPGCASRESRGFEAAVPLLLLLGGADDWTPPEPCMRLASQNVKVRAWDNAYHGFDGVSRLRYRTDIRTGVDPGGVHQGANRQAGEEARRDLLIFLEQSLGPAPTRESAPPVRTLRD